MEFIVKPPALIILKYLSKSHKQEVVGRIKRSLVSQVKKIDSILERLINDGYITSPSQAIISLTEKSINYLEEYDNFGDEYIFNNQADVAILKFLYEINTPLSIRWFPKIIQESCPSYIKSPNEGDDLQTYMIFHSSIKSYLINENGNFSLKQTGRNFYESILASKHRRLNEENFELENKRLQTKINQLTLESLEFQKENRELDIKLNEAQLREIKTKKLNSFLGAIGGAILTFLITYAKEIYTALKALR
jgi:hypothetical protein